MGMQFMIGFVQQKKSTFYFSIDCNTLDQKCVATMFTVFQEANLVSMMDGCSIFVWIQQAGRHPTCEEEKKNLLQLGFVYGFQEFCMLLVLFICRHTFGFSGEQGKLAQLACIDSQTIVYAIGCGLHRYRCMLHTILNPAHFTMIYMLIIIQVERERERVSLIIICSLSFAILGRFSIQSLLHQLNLTIVYVCIFLPLTHSW
jgi:hypothetical protein